MCSPVNFQGYATSPDSWVVLRSDCTWEEVFIDDVGSEHLVRRCRTVKSTPSSLCCLPPAYPLPHLCLSLQHVAQGFRDCHGHGSSPSLLSTSKLAAERGGLDKRLWPRLRSVRNYLFSRAPRQRMDLICFHTGAPAPRDVAKLMRRSCNSASCTAATPQSPCRTKHFPTQAACSSRGERHVYHLMCTPHSRQNATAVCLSEIPSEPR